MATFDEPMAGKGETPMENAYLTFVDEQRKALVNWHNILVFRDWVETQFARIAELQSQLDALTWTEITPEMKFDRSLDYLLGRPLRGCSVIRGDDFQRDGAGAHLKRVGWTHFRPINPPPPSGAKGETIVFQENINE